MRIRHLLLGLTAILMLTASAFASNACFDTTPFSCVKVDKTVTAKWVNATDSVNTPKVVATTVKATYANPDSTNSPLVRSRRAVIDTLNTWPQNTYQVLDSAKTGYAAIVTDTLRLSCGVQVCGYFVAGITGTGSGTAMTVGTLPATCRPSHTVQVPLGGGFTDNDSTRAGYISWATTGIGTLKKTILEGGGITATLTAGNTRAIPAGASFCFSRF